MPKADQKAKPSRRLVRHPREETAPVRDFGTVVRQQARRIRSAQGLTVEQLAARCEELGLTDFNSTLITAIEIGRKKSVTVDEWIQLAAALDVAPIHLLVPTDSEQETWVGEKQHYAAADIRRWVRGSRPLDFTNSRTYFTQVPEEEWTTLVQHIEVVRGEEDSAS
jgi:transcriptional regulator with XRE-family HTH domain